MPTVTQALKEFQLIAGVGSKADKTACAMSLLAWLDECDEWTDHPQCAHPLVAAWVIQANDHKDTTEVMRAQLVRLGMKGVLDTWWIPGVVLAESCRITKGATVPNVYDRTVAALQYLIVWKKTRPIINLTGAHLSGADLTGANLSRAILFGANLSGANLSRAILFGAHLFGADLTGADLSRADLFRADLFRANLSWANLSGANLSRANLSGANLSRAILFGANLSGANLSGADLYGAHGIPTTGVPAGWKIANGLYVRDHS